MERLRFGVVGVGTIGAKHIRLIGEKVPDAAVTGVCIRSPERRERFCAEHPEIFAFETAEELYHSGLVDAALVCTPHGDHPAQAIAAFGAGLHVLTEKPAGMYTAQVLEMDRAAARSGRVYGIMYNQRADPVYQKIRDMVGSGALGGLKRVTWTVTDWYRSQAYHDQSPWHSTWAGEGGGVVINQSIHQLDLWQWMFGMPDTVWARASFGKYHRIEVDDDVMAHFEYKNGLTGQYITSTGEAPGTNRLEIACDLGKLVCEDGRLTFYKNSVSEREFERENREPFARPGYETLDLTPEPLGLAGHAAILENFTSAVLRGTPLLAPGEEGIRAVTMANAILLSAWTGETVDLTHFPHDRYLRLLHARM